MRLESTGALRAAYLTDA